MVDDIVTFARARMIVCSLKSLSAVLVIVHKLRHHLLAKKPPPALPKVINCHHLAVYPYPPVLSTDII